MPLVLPNTLANEIPADGDKLEQNFDTIEDWANQDAITADGSTAMLAPLLLPGAPTQPNQAATKAYVDAGSRNWRTTLPSQIIIPAGSWGTVVTISDANIPPGRFLITVHAALGTTDVYQIASARLLGNFTDTMSQVPVSLTPNVYTVVPMIDVYTNVGTSGLTVHFQANAATGTIAAAAATLNIVQLGT